MTWATDHLRPASFRGVPFSVERASREGGRNVATHEYVLRDWPYHEDLGRRRRQFTLEALIVGADVLERAATLEAALDQPGAGQLVHPYYGHLMVVAVDAQRTEWDRRQGRVVRFQLTFSQDSLIPQPAPAAVVETADQVEAAADQAEGNLLQEAAAALRGLSVDALVDDALAAVVDDLGLTGVVDFVQDDVAAVINDVAAVINEAVAFVGEVLALPDRLLGEALGFVSSLGFTGEIIMGLVTGRSIGDLVMGRLMAPLGLFGSLVLGRSGGARLSRAVPRAGADTGAGVDIDRLVSEALADGETRPTVRARPALRMFLRLTQYEPRTVPPLPSESANAARRAQAANRDTLTTAVRTIAAIEAARMSARIDYDSADEAIGTRDQVLTALDDVADRVGAAGWDTAWQALADLRAATARDLAATAAQLPVLATHTPAAVLPAVVIAHRLYGDAPSLLWQRADDIVQRNKVAHPSFVPAVELEVRRWL